MQQADKSKELEMHNFMNDPNVPWHDERVDQDDGEIVYEAHGPRGSMVVFHGPNAKVDCEVFMAAVTTPNKPTTVGE